MSLPPISHLIPEVPLKFRRKSLSSSDDMSAMGSYSRNDSSSPISSSPLPPTPFASSSPPGYSRVHGSPGIAGVKGLREYSDDLDEISTSWGRGYENYGGSMKSLYASMPGGSVAYRDDKPSHNSRYGAYSPEYAGSSHR